MMIFCSWPLLVLAQVDSLTTESMITAKVDQISRESALNTPEWQLTIDVIKKKARGLMENDVLLKQEYDSLAEEYKIAQEGQREWELKNEALRQGLRQGHGRDEGQVSLNDLMSQVKSREKEVHILQNNFSEIKNENDSVDRVIGLKKLKISDIELYQKTQDIELSAEEKSKQQDSLENNDELDDLNQKANHEKELEENLQRQLEEIKRGFQGSYIPEPVNEAEIKVLQEKLNLLRKQKDDLQKQTNVDNNQPNNNRYLQLSVKKKDLQEKIKEFDEQLNYFKDPEALGVLNSKEKRQMVHQMSQEDKKNIQLRQKISNTKEDVSLLREQVNRLERKVNAAQK